MPALGGARDEAFAVPDEHGLTQAGSSRQYGDVGAFLLRSACVSQYVSLGGRDVERPKSESDQVIDQRDAANRHVAPKGFRIDDPRQVRRGDATGDDRSRHPEGRTVDPGGALVDGEECPERRFERWELSALEYLPAYRTPARVQQTQPRVRSTDVTDDEHEGRALSRFAAKHPHRCEAESHPERTPHGESLTVEPRRRERAERDASTEHDRSRRRDG